MSFKDIKGQEGPVQFLKNAAESKRLSHAYLFTGPDSVGKCMTARTLAKAVNCERLQTDSCDECSSCRKIDKTIHPDVRWISAGGNSGIIKISDIKEIRTDINLKPYEGRTKFYIIEKAHQMNDEAANSLLKTLEEPPRGSILILTSEKPERLFRTIKSRCQILRFKTLPLDALEGILKGNYNLTSEHSRFLAYFSGGRIGNAVSLIKENIILWKNEVIDKFTKTNIIFNEDGFFFDKDKQNLLLMLQVLAVWFRDILIFKKTQNIGLVINKDRIDDIAIMADRYSQADLLRISEEVLKTESLIQQNVGAKLAFAPLVLETEINNA